MEFDIKKGGKLVAGALGKAAGKAADVGSKVGTAVSEGAKELAERSKQENYLRRMRRYNPLFPDRYQSEEFAVPNMIKIVDDAERRGIDVCEGAIGWLEKKGEVEVLCLYDEAVEMSGLKFVPAPVCDSVYYVDRYDRTRFVQVDTIFSLAHSERMAELEHIAYSLGAKRCTVEIVESDAQSSGKSSAVRSKAGLKTGSVHTSAQMNAEEHSDSASTTYQRGVTESVFPEDRACVRPTLKWFQHDNSILNLVEICCSGGKVERRSLILEGSISATLSKSAAKAIDGAMGKAAGAKTEVTMEMRANKEHNSKLIFYVEF